MRKSDQPTDVAIGGAPGKETVISELLELSETLRIGHRGPFNKWLHRLDQSADDRPFEPPLIREPGAVPLVAALAERLEAVRQADPAIFNLFKARLKRGLENIEAGRAVSLVPPVDARTGHELAFANRLRSETLQPPEKFEPGKFTPLNSIRAPHGDGSAGWCVLFPDDAGGAFGHGRSQDGLLFTERPGDHTEAENMRFRQHLAAAREALLADARARRR